MPVDAYQLDKPLIDDGNNRIRPIYQARNLALGGALGAYGGRIQLAIGDRITWDDGTSIGATSSGLSPDDPAFGAKGDLQTVTNGVAVAGDATVTSATMVLTSADVGKAVRILGAGAAGADLQTTIASVNSATSFECLVAPATAVNPATVDWGTDDGPALQLWLDALKAQGGGLGKLNHKRYAALQNLGLTSAQNIYLEGEGKGASSIEDLRADDAVGAPTGTFRGLLSFLNCSHVAVSNMTLAGSCSDFDRLNSAQQGRSAIYLDTTAHVMVRNVEAHHTRDETLCSGGDCPDVDVRACHLHDGNNNAINVGGGVDQSNGLIVVGNLVENHQHAAFNCLAKNMTVVANVFGNPGLAAFGADLVILDSAASGVFANNVLHSCIWDAGSCGLHILGQAKADAVLIVADNVFRHMVGVWRMDGSNGAAIKVSDASQPPSCTVVISGNVVHDCECLDVAPLDNCCVRFAGVAAAFRAYVSGNMLVGNAAGFLQQAFFAENCVAGAQIWIGENALLDWETEYNDAGGVFRFNGSTRVTSVAIDDTKSPYTVPPGVSRVLVDSSAANVDVVLPAIATSENAEIQIVDWGQSASVHRILVAANGAETINGIASVSMTTDGVTLNAYCHGGEWKTLSPVI